MNNIEIEMKYKITKRIYDEIIEYLPKKILIMTQM